jgi:hypothetical protein
MIGKNRIMIYRPTRDGIRHRGPARRRVAVSWTSGGT